jgi:hypothetical protein
MLINLAINARNTMPQGGNLALEAANIFVEEEYCRRNCSRRDQFVVICLSNIGVGMPPRVLSRAFEPFFKTEEIGQGTSPGLSQVYGFVKQFGGHIKIYGEVGQGTTVKIYLPLEAPTTSTSTCSPRERCRNSTAEARNLFTSSGFGSRGRLREKAADGVHFPRGGELFLDLPDGPLRLHPLLVLALPLGSLKRLLRIRARANL